MLNVDKLTVKFNHQGKERPIIRDVCFHVPKGKFTAIVGESGSGKSVTALAILGFAYKSPGITAGSVVFNEKTLFSLGLANTSEFVLSDSEWKTFRGGKISYIPQEPRTSLDPLFTIGAHLENQLQDLKKKNRKNRAKELLHIVHLNPNRVYDLYPYQLSGGMCQLATIAVAIAADPLLIIADEPTTFLDARFQESVLALLYNLQEKMGTTLLFITHSFHIVEKLADNVVVMFNGTTVEEISSSQLFSNNCLHPYTRSLITGGKHSFQVKPDRLSGCSFAERCLYYSPDKCPHDKLPDIVELGDKHRCRCSRIKECHY